MPVLTLCDLCDEVYLFGLFSVLGLYRIGEKCYTDLSNIPKYATNYMKGDFSYETDPRKRLC